MAEIGEFSFDYSLGGTFLLHISIQIRGGSTVVFTRIYEWSYLNESAGYSKEY